jgi:hypothetical protein
MFYLFHRLGVQSNILVSARYEGGDLTKPAILDALRTVALKHSALWHVFVYRPCPKRKGQHIIDLATLNTIDLEPLVTIVEDDGHGLTSEFLEQFHNEWLYTTNEPDVPWWKLVVKGRDLVFVYHHALADGMSGQVFHRELLEALNSADATTAQADEQYILHRTDTKIQAPTEPLDVWKARHNIPELIWITLRWFAIFTWYGASYIYGSFPAPKPLPRDATSVLEQSQRNISRIVTHRIPAAKMARILAACRENGVTFTPLFLTMLTIVPGSEFFPTAKLGVSRYSYDLRAHLPMDKIEGATKNGIMFNASSGGQHPHRVANFRKAIPFEAGKNPKISTVRDAPIDAGFVWPLVKSYKEEMRKMTHGRGARLWFSAKILPSTLEGFVGQVWDALNRTLPPTYHVSNLGAFTADPVTGEKNDGPKTWSITDMQFSVGPTNGNIGSKGVIFSVAGVKGGDTVIHGNFEECVVSKDVAQDIIDRVTARIYELVNV